MINIGEKFVDLRVSTAKAKSNDNSSNSSIKHTMGIFLDPLTEKVCTLRTGEGSAETCFHATSVDSSSSAASSRELKFRTKEKGRIRSICFSPDLRLACIQQEDSAVDFLLLSEDGSKVLAEFRQVCRLKGAVVLGTHWAGDRHIALVADAGCEFYLINGQRRTLKLVKSLALSVNWHSFYPKSKLFVCASGISNNLLTCLTFQNHATFTLGKFEVDFGISPAKPRLIERDIAIASIYGKVCILVLKFEPINGQPMGLNIYEFETEGQQQDKDKAHPNNLPRLKYFLRLNLAGLVGVQVVDNLVLVHHKNAQTTLVFDIRHSVEQPVCTAPIRLHFKLAAHLDNNSNSAVYSSAASPVAAQKNPFLYNQFWKMSAHGFVLDLHYQLFTRLTLDLSKAAETIPDMEKNLQFLINRRGSERELLSLLRLAILDKRLRFSQLTALFRQILQGVKKGGADLVQNGSSASKWTLCWGEKFTPLLVSHNKFQSDLFEPLHQCAKMDKQFLANLMVDFFLTMKQKEVPSENHYMPELLLKVVADAKMWNKLQQLLQFRVIADSKFLALELIAQSAQYRPLYQIGLDMLHRRGNADQIVEVLLGQGHILEALSFVRDKTEDKILHKLLEAAWKTRDRGLGYTVYAHLQHMDRLKHLFDSSSDEFERYKQEYKLLFDKQEVEEMESRFRLARLTSINKRPRNRDFSFTSLYEEEEEGERRQQQNKEAGDEEHGEGSSTTSTGMTSAASNGGETSSNS